MIKLQIQVRARVNQLEPIRTLSGASVMPWDGLNLEQCQQCRPDLHNTLIKSFEAQNLEFEPHVDAPTARFLKRGELCMSHPMLGCL